ncbi:MAG: helix-hairpin-helix domain-containing protein [Clostridia bacterium]|nr:helix-hairpin-helix domain-containing protein [Clostridia bacterium]
MSKLNKKILLYIFTIALIVIICFKIDYDRKPHFKVIRGEYDEIAVPVITDSRININTATLEELDKLEGIGPVIAERIILYREKNPFSSIEQIMNVKGIGKKKYDAIKNLITVD